MTAQPGSEGVSGMNPYSPTAVAVVTEQSTAITVPTKPFQEARRLLDNYLGSTYTATDPPGRVVSVVGEFGTGKTQLAAELWRRARKKDRDAFVMYMDAPQEGAFTELHQRFIRKLDKDDVSELLRDYHADVVADDLARTPGADEMAEKVRDGEIDPLDVTRAFDLMDSALRQTLQDRLITISDDPDLGTALTLLLDPQLTSAAWDWLAGEEPNDFLRDLGISRRIDSESDALRTMLAFARLYRHRAIRFILIMDEFDKTLTAAAEIGTAVGDFRRTLEQFEQAGAFIVLSGLTDMLKVIGEETLQRFGRIIRMTPMTPRDVRIFIQRSHAKTRGDDALTPFTPHAVDYLVGLTNGVPRPVIRLCHNLYQEVMDTGAEMTEAMIREVARERIDFPSLRDVRREAIRLLHQEGVPYASGTLRDAEDETIVDVWVQNAVGERQCAVIILSSVLTPDDVTHARRRADAARADATELEIILVVVGYLADEVAADLQTLSAIAPIEYHRHTFPEELNRAVDQTLRQRGEHGLADSPAVLRQRLDTLSRQQANVHEVLGLLDRHVSDFEQHTEQQFDALLQAMTALASRGTPGASGGRRTATSAESLPERISEIFTQVLSDIARLHRLDKTVREAFDVEPRQAASADGAQAIIRAAVHRQDGLIPLGAAVFLRVLVEAFRDAVFGWYRTSGAWTGGGLTEIDRERLERVCRRYDSLFIYVPVLQLKRLSEFTAKGSERDLAGFGAPTVHLEDLQQSFEQLGARVRAALLRESLPARPDAGD